MHWSMVITLHISQSLSHHITRIGQRSQYCTSVNCYHITEQELEMATALHNIHTLVNSYHITTCIGQWSPQYTSVNRYHITSHALVNGHHITYDPIVMTSLNMHWKMVIALHNINTSVNSYHITKTCMGQWSPHYTSVNSYHIAEHA